MQRLFSSLQRLPVWLRWIGAIFFAVLLGGIAGAGLYRFDHRPSGALFGTVLENPHYVGNIRLTAHTGEPFALSQSRGRLMLVFFGFVRCPDECPLTMGRLARIYENLSPAQRAQVDVVLVTVDPSHDSPEVLGNYVRAFHSDFMGLTGSSADIANAARDFFVGFREIAGEQFMHNDHVSLIDRQGLLRVVYRQDNVMHIADDLPQLLASSAF